MIRVNLTDGTSTVQAPVGMSTVSDVAYDVTFEQEPMVVPHAYEYRAPLTPWTCTGASIIIKSMSADGANGTWGPLGVANGIKTVLALQGPSSARYPFTNLTVGQAYVMQYWLKSRNGYPVPTVSVGIEGGPTQKVALDANAAQQHSTEFTATSTQHTFLLTNLALDVNGTLRPVAKSDRTEPARRTSSASPWPRAGMT